MTNTSSRITNMRTTAAAPVQIPRAVAGTFCHRYTSKINRSQREPRGMLPCIYGDNGPLPSSTPTCHLRLFLLTKGSITVAGRFVCLLERLGSQAGEQGVGEQAEYQDGSDGW